MNSEFRNIPSVNAILECPKIIELIEEYSHDSVTELAREVIQTARTKVQNGEHSPQLNDLVLQVVKLSETRWGIWPKQIINATGVVLHTNLGRAPLSPQSIEAAHRATTGYSSLEISLSSGKRGSRQAQISENICQLTGAESALVVNNNAAAVVLGLAAISNQKEVIVSRSEAVEIGGGFRIPDVLNQSGAFLKEVGTTNRTYSTDFANAINESTGALMSIHASNFKIVGFTHSPNIKELSEIAKAKGIPLLHDVGSGCLLDTKQFGLDPEPTPQESIAQGADVAFFSADKLLGGPQAGIIVGKKNYMDKISMHPLARAFRIDKMNLAALNTTLMHYIKDEATEKIPIWQMISASKNTLENRANHIKDKISGPVRVENTKATVGGGSLPGNEMDSIGLVIYGLSPEKISKKLRTSTKPVIGRIESDKIVLDIRTVLPDEDNDLADSIKLAIR